MEANKSALSWFLLSLVFLSLRLELTQCNVGYDRKALVINGQRKILFSGSIHYPRSTPQVFIFLFYFLIMNTHLKFLLGNVVFV